MNIIIASILLFIVSFFMNMVGKGGGNFYVLILTLFGFSIYQSATIGQFILFFSSLSAVIVFYKNKKIIWNIVLIIVFFLFVSSFAGGYFSHIFSEQLLKLFFSFLLLISGIIILIPKKTKKNKVNNKKSIILLSLFIMFIGFFSGMLGVSGGSFIVPLIYFLFNISMQSAIATSSVLISLSALSGFTGHVIQGDFNLIYAVFFAIITVVGGVLGSKITLISKQYSLKYIFAISNFIASILMILKIYHII